MNFLPLLINRDKLNYFKGGNINTAHRFIFIHIPKNAGTSVNRSLRIEGAHFTAQQYREKLGLHYNFFFKFCFARNPWSRFLSLYNYARMEESYYHSAINPQKARFGKHLDYDVLKDATLNQCAHLLLEGKLRHDNAWLHWLPQTHWISDNKGRCIVDFIGRVESIKDDLKYISKKIKLDIAIDKINASGDSNNYRKFFDDETRQIIELYYASDIETFGYTF